MIHPATTANAKAIKALIRRQHLGSKYADRCGISDKALDGIVDGMIAQQNQHGPQGSYVAVALQDGIVTGLLAGVLERVYHIGDKLTAADLFFVNESGKVGDTLALVDAYVAWARRNRRVIEIMLSWNDALPGADRVAKLFTHKGFAKTGEMYELRADLEAEGIAA